MKPSPCLKLSNGWAFWLLRPEPPDLDNSLYQQEKCWNPLWRVVKTSGSFWSSSQDGGVGRKASLPHTTKRRITTTLNKKQPELPENQTAWNSDNQEVKETFIQTGRRGRDWRTRPARWGWLSRKLKIQDL